MKDDGNLEFSQDMASFMTTEHSTLSGARSIINAEISSRINIYFTTLSAVLIAAAFIAQIESAGQLFLLFGWIAVPLVILLGFFTLARLIFLGGMDMVTIRAMNRIRYFYVKAAPSARTYMLFPPYDDIQSSASYAGWNSTFRGNLLSNGNIVNITNSLVAVLGIGAITYEYFGVPINQFLPYSVVVLILFYSLQGYLGMLLVRGDRRPEYMESRFPSPENENEEG